MAATRSNKDRTQLTLYPSSELRKALRIRAAIKDKSMSETALEILRKGLEKELQQVEQDTEEEFKE